MSFLGLWQTGPHGPRPSHQTLMGRLPSQTWLQKDTVASLFQECLLNHCLTHPKTTMRDGKAVWGNVCGNAGAVSDYCDEDRTEPHGKALDLLGCLSSNPHWWSWALGSNTSSQNEVKFFLRVTDHSLRDKVRSSDIQWELRVESLLLRIKRNQSRWDQASHEDASRPPPLRGVPGMSIWVKASRWAQDFLDGFHIPPGLGKPWGPTGGAGKCCLRERCLGNWNTSAATATWFRVNRRKLMNGHTTALFCGYHAVLCIFAEQVLHFMPTNSNSSSTGTFTGTVTLKPIYKKEHFRRNRFKMYHPASIEFCNILTIEYRIACRVPCFCSEMKARMISDLVFKHDAME